MNQWLLFNDGWTFSKSSLDRPHPTDPFLPVEIPHDWLIYDTTNLYENSIGWYRKEFIYDPSMRNVSLYFEGVYMDCSLYVNGSYVGEWKYGYSSFELELSSAIKPGVNEILLKVIHQSPNSRWYTGAGIYRNVWLRTKGASFIQTHGVYIAPRQMSAADWNIEVETEVVSASPTRLVHSLYQDRVLLATTAMDIHQDQVNQQKLTIQSPQLWSPESPTLYQLRTELWLDDVLIDSVDNPVGFRTIELDPNKGLVLNGKKMKINGVCEHHDLGALGAAFNKSALRRRLSLLKQMGVNGIRTAHNMPAKELMNLADEMGFLIVSEAFDMWERPKTNYDYARFFNDWAYRDVESWVKRDRNHPSLFMWSIGNEVYDTHADERGIEITRQLKNFVLEFDPKQNGYVTFGSNYLPWENTQKCADVVKVVGYNYSEKYYQQHHEEHPDWIIYGSETASVVQSRGVYHFPFHQSKLADDDLQCSSLGNSSTSWGAKSPEACIIAERDTAFSLGQFIWTGFDYIGEPTPYHTKNAYFGQLDTATFAKDSYYIYQANWTDYKKAPMIHLFPYWDFNPGQMIDVRVATNAPKFELFLNNQLIESKVLNHQTDQDLIPTFRIPYEPGELRAVAYDENGTVIASTTRHSFSDAVALRLQPDRTRINADGQDVVFVEINAVDRDNYPVENASNRVSVNVTGPGRLIGLDNGDSSDYDQYKGTSRRLFNGRLMAIIAPTYESGQIEVTVASNGMEPISVMIESQGSFDPHDIYTHNCEREIETGQLDELPVRKIELHSSNGQHLTAQLHSLTVSAQVFPPDATYQDLEWSVVNDAGIGSNIATIEAAGTQANLTALGDGDFRVRCTTQNGTDHTVLISELEMTASGLGPAYKNPYAFISAGLYDDSKGQVTNGNERGIATSRDGETQVGFHDIDFGKHGSDIIHLPIFALSDAPYHLEIWEGVPRAATSTLLGNFVYQKKSIWNVYQPVTYQLTKKLTGLTSLYFVLQDKIHLKGFSFEANNRARELILATEADEIYGDSFKRTPHKVEEIGNNVSLVFNDLDFGETGVAQLTISGDSPIDKNTIHVHFDGAMNQNRQIIEFDRTNGYETKSFVLDRVKGLQTVTFVFLPGSHFNFDWFQFS